MNSPSGMYIITAPSAGRIRVEPMPSVGTRVADGGAKVGVAEGTVGVLLATGVSGGGRVATNVEDEQPSATTATMIAAYVAHLPGPFCMEADKNNKPASTKIIPHLFFLHKNSVPFRYVDVLNETACP